MRIEDVIGHWITQAREESRMTQAEIGVELGKYLGKPWPRQAVSAAEKGRRSFTAAELVALAYVLGYSVEALLVPPPDVPAVTLADGPPLDARHLRGSAATASDESLRKAVTTMSQLRAMLPALIEGIQEIDAVVADGLMELWAAARGRGIQGDDLLGLPARDTP